MAEGEGSSNTGVVAIVVIFLIVVINGGYRDVNSFELWLVPQGAEAPRPTPTVSPEERRTRRD